MKDFKNKVAAITGAASGMGRTLAVELARRGCHLALSDVNEKGLAETAQLAAKLGVKVTTSRLGNGAAPYVPGGAVSARTTITAATTARTRTGCWRRHSRGKLTAAKKTNAETSPELPLRATCSATDHSSSTPTTTASARVGRAGTRTSCRAGSTR